jgi:hypothetical protein
METQFVYHPRTTQKDQTQIAMIKDDIAGRGAPLWAQLQDGPRRLAGFAAAVEARRRSVDPHLDELHDRWLQAGADLKICGQRLDPLPAPPTSVAPKRRAAPPQRAIVFADRPWNDAPQIRLAA